jgi:DNA-binding MarR family transcriptional regulator
MAPSRPSAERARLLQALEGEIRTMSTRTVMLSQAIAGRLGLSPTDLETLEQLEAHGPVTAGRLAELTGLTTGAITGLVDRLEEAGFVRRDRDPDDRRRVIVHLVPERARRIGKMFEPVSRAMAELHAQYSDAELALFVDYLTRANAVGHELTTRLERDPAARERS